jgi:uncharacterized protein YndB with AHSA1/START domain
MTNETGKSTVTFPNELDIVIHREFKAPIELVFDVFTKPEHVQKTFATFGETFTTCTIDLRVGGSYHFVMVTTDGIECSFRGSYLEIDAPHRTVATWSFEGWPGVEAVESVDLYEANEATMLTWKLSFPDKASRAHMKKTNGPESNFDSVDEYLTSLLHSDNG